MQQERKAEGKSLNPGQKLQGEHGELYRIERVCGQGSFGITYEATCMRAAEVQQTNGLRMERGQRLAIKECFDAETMRRRASGFVELTDEKRGSRLRKLFEEEALMIARCQRQLPVRERGDVRTGFVPIYQAGKYVSARAVSVEEAYRGKSLFYYVMPYIDGGKLEDYIGRLSTEEEVWLVYRMLEVLKKFHGLRDGRSGKKLVHRDIKPSNIMVTQDGYPVLVDYGGTVSGMRTIAYAAPEQMSTTRTDPVTELSDMYSFAVSLYRILTEGEMPPKAFGLPRDAFTLLSERRGLREKFETYGQMYGYGRSWGKRFLQAIDLSMDLHPRNRCSATEWLGYIFPHKPHKVWHGVVDGRRFGTGIMALDWTLYEEVPEFQGEIE